MASPHKFAHASVILLGLLISGCAKDQSKYHGSVLPPDPLGTISDPIWQQQEANAEASDFVIHEHEFVGNSVRLNNAGEQHVQQIAARADEVPFPILVEPSSMSRRKSDRYGFPVHPNAELDKRRRDVIVRALTKMGVDDAARRVTISPALTPGFEHFEAERAYQSGFSIQGNRGSGGFGGVSGGFGGGFGGF